MSIRKKQILINLLAFVLLFSVSLYRQLSLRFIPDDIFRTYILYTCYVLLISLWLFSVLFRIMQASIRRFLTINAIVIFAGLTLRFLQDTFWTDNILLMRNSGQFISTTILPIMLLGLYASLCVGTPDDYKINKKWYWLIVPVVILLLLSATDDKHHFICYVIPDESQPNLYFHPYIGSYLIYLFGGAILTLRSIIILKKNHAPRLKEPVKILIAIFEPILLLGFTFPYLLDSFLGTTEVIEFYAKVYYIDIITWEFYIFLGLVPSNGWYNDIFTHSTIAMQIIERNGNHLLSSKAKQLSDDTFGHLLQEKTVMVENGVEAHLHEMSDSYFVWNEDISALQKTIDDLRQTAEMLAQEETILESSIKTKREEAEISAKNQIYNDLIKEVGTQLRLMKEISEKQISDSGIPQQLHQLYILGTYVKRRCNLRLIEKEQGYLPEADLRLSIQNLLASLDVMNIKTDFHYAADISFSAAFSIRVFDMLEYLLEHEHFEMDSISVSLDVDGAVFTILFKDENCHTGHPCLLDTKAYRIDLLDLPNGYRLTLSESRE